ncbi:putative cell shape-determining protein [Streptococcus intermedius]|uniref:Cell shape-determining protein MreC n=1 Tax=Streptococcus intermedius TaxID=1338 RepID=A0AAD1FI90_STRIT|nr:rod shape-determining protein MreC [Streptococcus intermedius]BAW16004.1 putative cell shape-determining protein [Streptococcus intermedius]
MKKSKFVVMATILIIVTSVLLVSTRSLGVVNKASNVVSVLDNIVSKPFNFLAGVKSDLTDLTRTYKENKQLKKALFKMEEQLAASDSLKDENSQLRQLLEMKNLYESKKKVSADVVSRIPVSWLAELTVNAGHQNGVQNTMLAVANGGLIGSVKDVASHSSRVNLLTNNKNIDNISVRIQTDTGTIYGVIIGYSKEKTAFIISQLNSSDTIKEGAKVVTSGLGTYNIPNIPVGTVLSVTEKSDHLTKEVFVKPSADLTDIHVVTLVGS